MDRQNAEALQAHIKRENPTVTTEITKDTPFGTNNYFLIVRAESHTPVVIRSAKQWEERKHLF